MVTNRSSAPVAETKAILAKKKDDIKKLRTAIHLDSFRYSFAFQTSRDTYSPLSFHSRGVRGVKSPCPLRRRERRKLKPVTILVVLALVFAAVDAHAIDLNLPKG